MEDNLPSNSENPTEDGDPSHELDLVTVFQAAGAEAEMEAVAVRSLLEASGIAAVLVGSSALPSLPFEVRVPADRADEARARIAEAAAAGPSAAEEAERSTE